MRTGGPRRRPRYQITTADTVVGLVGVHGALVQTAAGGVVLIAPDGNRTPVQQGLAPFASVSLTAQVGAALTKRGTVYRVDLAASPACVAVPRVGGAVAARAARPDVVTLTGT